MCSVTQTLVAGRSAAQPSEAEQKEQEEKQGQCHLRAGVHLSPGHAPSGVAALSPFLVLPLPRQVTSNLLVHNSE